MTRIEKLLTSFVHVHTQQGLMGFTVSGRLFCSELPSQQNQSHRRIGPTTPVQALERTGGYQPSSSLVCAPRLANVRKGTEQPEADIRFAASEVRGHHRTLRGPG